MNGHTSHLLSMSTLDANSTTVKLRSRPSCASCDSAVVLHQPDPSAPSRLLGVCEDCHAWTIVRSIARGKFELTLIAEPE